MERFESLSLVERVFSATSMNNFRSTQQQGPSGYQGDIPSRPSSANSFDSYSRDHHQRGGPSSYSGGYGQRDLNQGGRGRYDDQVDAAMMSKNAGQLGLDPTNMAPIKKAFYQEHPEVASMTPAQVDEFRRNAQMVITGKNVPK